MTNTVGRISQRASSVEWEIGNFSTLSSLTGDGYVSPEFQWYGATWILMIYPNGHEHDDRGFISLFLKLTVSPNSRRIVSFKISIKKKSGNDYTYSETTHELTENKGRGWGRFVKRSKVLEKLLTQDLLRISCAITDHKSIDIPSQKKSSRIALEALTHSLKDLFLNQINPDITVKVQEDRIPAHKLILAARSSVFANMLREGTEESNKGVIEITGFEPKYVKDFLLYIYSGCTEKITFENVFELYSLSKKFYVEGLKTECVEFLKKNLSGDNIRDILLFAKKNNEVLLEEAANLTLTDNAPGIVPSDLWSKFRNKNNSITLEELQSIALDRYMKAQDI